MNSGPLVVFLGPSLRHEEARELLPGVICLPPAAMGDIIGAVTRLKPRAIGLVDGTFLANMSVFHKEILYAMDQGIWMLGASSMGALRAAECDNFGMIGVGEIYAALASGELQDDDEVALTHSDEEFGFKSLSDALVTIRATIAAAHATGLLTQAEADSLVALQKARWFPDRRLSDIASDAAALGIDAQRCNNLKEFTRTSVVDPKRADAIALLKRMSQLPSEPIPEDQWPHTEISGAFRAMLARDVVVESPAGFPVTFDRIRKHAALHDTEYEEDMRRTRQELALSMIAVWIGGMPTDDEIAHARIRIARRAGVELAALESWAQELDVDTRSLKLMLHNEALVSRMETSWLGRTRMGEITGIFLNQVRIAGRYPDMKAAAALLEAAAKDVTLSPEPTSNHLIVSTAALGTWEIPGDFNEYIDQSDFGSVPEMLEAMSVSIRAHHALFGVGLVDLPEGSEPILVIENQEPMMSRGN
jgi:hypothetical protein